MAQIIQLNRMSKTIDWCIDIRACTFKIYTPVRFTNTENLKRIRIPQFLK